MKGYIYCIKDVVADQYLPIFEANNDEVAIRDFNRSIKNNKEIEPDDYRLLRLGVIVRNYENDVSTISISTEGVHLVVTGGKDG